MFLNFADQSSSRFQNGWCRRFFVRGAMILSLLCCVITTSYSSDLYFLCGPDEDGCFEDDYSSCACIPHDSEAYTPHCLDTRNIRCTPLSQAPNCSRNLIFKNQGDCLATIFHSTPTTPCHIKTRSFCIEHRIPFCDQNGDPYNCHSQP